MGSQSKRGTGSQTGPKRLTLGTQVAIGAWVDWMIGDRVELAEGLEYVIVRFSGDGARALLQKAGKPDYPLVGVPVRDLVAWPDDDRCRTCGARYADGGDGFDGECPTCADTTDRRLREAGSLDGGRE